jgi:hypothetical protein
MSDSLPMAIDPHLTPGPDKTFEQRLRSTYPGMAHLAGSGPPGRTCRECEFFRGRDYYAKDQLAVSESVKAGPLRQVPRTDAKAAVMAGGSALCSGVQALRT